MDDISVNSLESWHTCKEENQNLDQQKTNKGNIIKDLNLNLTHDSEADSIDEFENIINNSNVFSKFKSECENENNFLKLVTPSGSIKKDNSNSLPKFLKPDYLNRDNTITANIYVNTVEVTNDVPSIDINEKKMSNNLLTVPGIKNNISDKNQSSSVTLVDSEIQDDFSVPVSSLDLIKNTNKKNNKTENNVNDKVEDFKDNFKERFSKGKEEIEDIIPDDEFQDAKQELNENEVVNENKNNNDENDQGTLGRLFGYFRGLGKSENVKDSVEDNVNEKTKINNNNIEIPDKNTIKATKDFNNQSKLQLPAALGTEYSSVTIVNDDIEENEDDEEEFVNALEVQPENNNNNEINDSTDEEVIFKDTVTNNDNNAELLTQGIGKSFNEGDDDDKSPQHKNNINIPIPNQNDVFKNEVNNNNKTIPIIPNESIIEDYNTTEEFVNAVTVPHNDNLNDESQFITNIAPIEIPDSEDSIIITKNDPSILENNTNTRPLNVELVPVNKPVKILEEVSMEEADVSKAKMNILLQPSDTKPRKSRKMKEKMKKWYHKIFRFSLCNRHKDDYFS